jgi:poly(3-hydroxybutyrate) depolymerase
MSKRILCRWSLCAIILSAALGAATRSTVAHHDAIPDQPPLRTEARLPVGLDLDGGSVTVSGLSSGGFFAHQFHIAHSSLVSGAGIVAGGPYGCTEVIPNPFWPWSSLNPVSAAVVACTHYYGDRFWGLRPAPPGVDQVLSLIADAVERRAIDDPANLPSSRVWLFRGSADTVVPESVAEAVADVYRALGVEGSDLQIGQEYPGNPAGHGMPVARFPVESRFPPRACSDRAPPFLVGCGFDAAGLLLQHLYPEGFRDEPADPHDAGTLSAFSQTEFFDAGNRSGGLSGVGYIYVPTACREASCRLHVAFHGCRQNADAQGPERVHDDFVRDAGYNGWAAANRIVVLYPQATASAGNPNACWDFWGYSGAEYRDREGVQMRAVRAMISRLRSED